MVIFQVTTAKTAKKTPIDIWDLHVGAVIIVLGKRLELKKVSALFEALFVRGRPPACESFKQGET